MARFFSIANEGKLPQSGTAGDVYYAQAEGTLWLVLNGGNLLPFRGAINSDASFTGPQGAQGVAGAPGDPGTPGQGFKFTGAFDPGVQYELYNVLTWQGSAYVCITRPPGIGFLPDSEYFQLFAAKGDPGPAGGSSSDATKIQHIPVSASAPANGQVLAYNSQSGDWEPGDPLVQGI